MFLEKLENESVIEFPSFTKFFGVWFIDIREFKTHTTKYLSEMKIFL